jgi:hypothetical protein
MANEGKAALIIFSGLSCLIGGNIAGNIRGRDVGYKSGYEAGLIEGQKRGAVSVYVSEVRQADLNDDGLKDVAVKLSDGRTEAYLSWRDGTTRKVSAVMDDRKSLIDRKYGVERNKEQLDLLSEMRQLEKTVDTAVHELFTGSYDQAKHTSSYPASTQSSISGPIGPYHSQTTNNSMTWDKPLEAEK